MKNLHRKISAMLLAGMLVVGGVALSGVNSLAVSKGYNIGMNSQIQRVKSIVNGYGGEVLLESRNGSEIDKFVQKHHSGIGSKYQKHSGRKINNPYQIPLHLNNAKRFKRELVKIQCQDFYYLIKVN